MSDTATAAPTPAPSTDGDGSTGGDGAAPQSTKTPTTVGGKQLAATPAPSKSPAAPKTPAQPASDWSDDDEKAAWALLKRAPWAKYEVKGKPVAVDSLEAWKKTTRNAQRVDGLNDLLSGTAKEKEALAARAAKIEEQEKRFEAARRGDQNAWRELGLMSPQEKSEREAALAEMPPEVRAVIERNEQLERAQAEREAAEKRSQAKAREAATLKQANDIAQSVAESLGVASNPDLLFDAIEAIHDLEAAGGILGENITAEDVRDYALQNHESGGIKRVSSMPLEKTLSSLAPLVSQASVEQLASALEPDAMEAFAVRMSRWLYEKRTGGKRPTSPVATPTPEPTQQQTESRPAVGRTLSFGLPRRK